MKLRMIGATALVAMAGTLPAMAQTYYAPPPDPAPVIVPVPGETIYVPLPALPSGSPIHGGWVAPGDDVLLNNTVAALAAAPGMEQMTVTIVAKNGELILNGVAKDVKQAARIERIAKQVAGGRVTSQFTTQLG